MIITARAHVDHKGTRGRAETEGIAIIVIIIIIILFCLVKHAADVKG